MRQCIGEDTEEGLLLRILLLEPCHSTLVDKLSRVLGTVQIVGVTIAYAMLDVLVQPFAAHILIFTLGVGVEEVGIVAVSLILADVAIVLVEAPCHGG